MKRCYKKTVGFSLIELMVGITVGLIIVAGVAAIFGTTIRSDKETLASVRLNQDMSTVIQIMSSELVRAGYSGPAGEIYGDLDRNGADDANSADVVIGTVNTLGDCVLFSYNRDSSDDTAAPLIADNERNGFRLNNGALEMRTTCTPGTCDTSCGAGTWVELTDPSVVNITSLTFTSTGSKCRYVDDEIYWSVDSDSATGFACAAASANVCTDGDGDGIYTCAAGAPPVPALPDNDHVVDVRQINIAMAGELTNDNSVTKKLQTSSKVMNHMVRYVPGT